MTSPRTEALAYRIWSVANPRGWNMTCTEIADELDETTARIRSILSAKKWGGRLRSSDMPSIDMIKTIGFASSFDGDARLMRGDGVNGI